MQSMIPCHNFFGIMNKNHGDAFRRRSPLMKMNDIMVSYLVFLTLKNPVTKNFNY